MHATFVRRWLGGFAVLVSLMVLVGGFVRLTRSGLSIVEWNPISGAIPPLTERAWEEEFAKYQQTPEYQKINRGMTLEEYRYIFWIEWIHRQLARAVGLYFAVPFLWFWLRGQLPREHRGKLFAIGLLFVGQAVMGWLMVASGLVDQPAVSHFRLTAHLLLALSLIALTVWTVRSLRAPLNERLYWNRATAATTIALGILTVQIIYGGMTAGLKAGYLSDSWPLMFGVLVPSGLFTFVQPAWLNLLEAPVTVMFVHRWLPFLALLLLPLLWRAVRQVCGYTPATTRLLWGLAAMLGVQILLGILVVLTHVSLPLALVHQGGAIVLVVLLVRLLHTAATVPGGGTLCLRGIQHHRRCENKQHSHMAKRRALIFLHKQPYPPSDSTKFRVYHSVIEQLAEYQRDVFIVTWEKANPAASAQLRSNGQFECYSLPLWQVCLNILKRAFSMRPWQVEMLYDPAIEQRFRALAEEADVIYVHTLRLGRYLEKLPLSLRRKVILDLNDSIARHYVRGWRSYPLALRLPVLLEGIKFRRYERAMVKRFEHVTIVGEDDCAYVAAGEEHKRRPVVINTAVPSRQSYPAQLDADGELNLYFLGNFHYFPNREGIEWFLGKVWPQLTAQIPRLRFYLIGDAPASLRRRFRALEGIEWTGFLPEEELEALLGRMHIFISPVRIGAGIQGKIIEALFAGKPVIAAEEATLWVRHFPMLERLISRASDVSSWKGALEQILAHYDELCAELRSEQVRSFLERSFSIQSVGAHYRRLADAIIGRMPPAPHTTSTSAR